MLQRGTKLIRMFRRVTKNRITRGNACVVAITAIGLLISNLALIERPAQSQTIFENVTIRPRFSPDPMTIRGISGGSVPASNVGNRKQTPTGPCVGFMDKAPDHTLVLTSFFNYFSLVVESPQDTTLVISGPGGTWCNDDFQGKNPGIAGQWQAGSYRVWVGSYDTNNYHPYLIRLSASRLLNPGPSRR